MHLSLISVCSFLAAAIAAPAADTKRHAVHERRERLPAHWKRSAKLHGDSNLQLRIALTQSNLDRADEFLMDVAHPESPNYGKHVCILNVISPSPDFVAVVKYLSMSACGRP
jgi:tripeptidyl-peptidase-1